jgi:dTDP-glucose 4,6-dehydratase
MTKTRIVYITGCLGFIGSYITETCLKLGWQVRGIDKCSYAANLDLLDTFNIYTNFTFEKIDINDIPFLYDCDYIINTAASTHVTNSIVDSEEFIHDNIHGIYHILELMKKYRNDNQPIFFQISSDEVFGDILHGEHTEKDLLKPSSPYSASKACGDMLILAWARTYGIPYVIVRPTNNYGIRQYVEKLIPKTCKYLQLGRKIPLHDNGIPTRNWLHAQDTANAIITIINSDIKNEIFNIAGHFEQSNLITVKKIIECYYGVKDINIEDYIEHTIRPGQDLRYAINDDKLCKLGWNPKKIFDNELPNIVNYYKERFIW